MRKSLITLLVAAAPLAASAQVELISGFNFGQFVAAGEPSTNGVTFEYVGFINSNFAGNTAPGPQDSGIYRGNQGLSTSFSAGSGTIYWNGTNGSSNWTFATGVAAYEHGSFQAVNHNLVNGSTLISGDDNNAGLNLNSGSGNSTVALVVNTTGFSDFNPSSYAQPNDFNFTFSAFANSGGTASVEWFFGVTSLGSFTANAGAHQAFSLDLPVGFYGNSNSTLTAVISGDIVIDNVQINGVSAIPEPASFGAIAGVMCLGLAASRRRRVA